jgi:hypothetical protein
LGFVEILRNCRYRESKIVGRDVGCRVIWGECIGEVFLGDGGRGIIDVFGLMEVRYSVVKLTSCKIMLVSVMNAPLGEVGCVEGCGDLVGEFSCREVVGRMLCWGLMGTRKYRRSE